jgi:pantoate--beta-alanine ligase
MGVELLLSIDELRDVLDPIQDSGKSVGLVPTMGALHRGHASLIEESVTFNDYTVVSIFVNPIQFDDKSDLAAYPKTLDSDMQIAEDAGADFIFCPAAEEMYTDGFSTFVDMSGPATEVMCGASRPGHFRGVTTVVSKLFGIVGPDYAYFGEKDAQQLFIIKKMVRELNIPVIVVGCSTVRDRDSLAISSRNARLSEDERLAARCLVRALLKAGTVISSAANAIGPASSAGTISYALTDYATTPANYATTRTNNATVPALDAGPTDSDNPIFDTAKIRASLVEFIEKEPLARLDYAEVLDADTFEPVSDDTVKVLCAVAAYFGETRLIDNVTYKVNGHEYGCPCCS